MIKLTTGDTFDPIKEEAVCDGNAQRAILVHSIPRHECIVMFVVNGVIVKVTANEHKPEDVHEAKQVTDKVIAHYQNSTTTAYQAYAVCVSVIGRKQPCVVDITGYESMFDNFDVGQILQIGGVIGYGGCKLVLGAGYLNTIDHKVRRVCLLRPRTTSSATHRDFARDVTNTNNITKQEKARQHILATLYNGSIGTNMFSVVERMDGVLSSGVNMRYNQTPGAFS
jgi:hypothetical protein